MFASSKAYPNCTPVFFKYYVISLLCDWYEYPKDITLLDNCEIYGLKGGVDIDDIKNSFIKDPKFHTVEKDKRIKGKRIYW